MKNDEAVRIPEIEVIVRIDAGDVATAAFFLPPVAGEDVEVLLGCVSPSVMPTVVEALRWAIAALNASDWQLLLGLFDDEDERDKDEPF